MPDYNGMQAQLGLLSSNSNGMQGVPTPTMPMSMPTVIHPGEFSAMATRASQAVMYNTLQTAGLGFNQAPAPSIFNAAMSGSASSAASMFASQYQSNMRGITGQHMNPYVAQALGGMGGGYGSSGFNAGMMPSPSYFTSPDMGIFRGFSPPPMHMMAPTPRMPLIQTPFNAGPAMPPMFQTPFDQSISLGRNYSDQMTAAAMATPGAAAHFGGTLGGAGIGGAIGAAFGRGLGGRTGASLGMWAGAAMGGYGMETGGFSDAIGGAVDRLNPLRTLAPRAAQMQTMSQNFVVGGNSVDAGGRGMSMPASYATARGLEDLGYSRQFRRETGNMFNTNDVFKIAQGAGANGLLDTAQDPQAIVGQVKTLAKSLRAFMQVANEPDVMEAIRQMGQMRSMGISVPETTGVMSAAKMFARMGGTSVQGIMEAGGLPGAMMYQQQGLSAGLGMQMGIGALGMARSSVASGTYNTQQLAMLGGVSGVAQRDMQANAAFLKTPMIAAAMSQYDPRTGSFGVNAGNVGALRNGGMGMVDMVRMGAANLTDAVGRGGVGALGMFMMQQDEIQDSVGRRLGPMGTTIARMRQVQNLSKTMQMQGPGGFVTAAMMMGMSPEEARQLAQQSANPETFANARKHLNLARVEESDRYRDFIGNRTSEMDGRLSRGADSVFRGFRRAQEGIGSALSEFSDDERYVKFRTPESLTMGRRDRERLRRDGLDWSSGGVARGTGGSDDALFRLGGEGYGRSALVGKARELMGGDALAAVREAEGSYLGGGVLEKVGRVLEGSPYSSVYGSAREIRRRAESIGSAQRDLVSGLDFKTSNDAKRGIREKFGVEKGTQIIAEVERRIAKQMNDNRDPLRKSGLGMGTTAALSDDQISKIKEEMVRDGKLSKEDAAKLDLTAMKKSGAAGAMAMADKSSADAMSGIDPSVANKKRALESSIDAARDSQKALNANMFGEAEGLLSDNARIGVGVAAFINPAMRTAAAGLFAVDAAMSAGEREKQEQARELLFNGSADADVGLLASLKLAAADDPAADKRYQELLNKKLAAGNFDESEIERLLSTASSAGLTDQIKAAGKRYSKIPGNSAAVQDMFQGDAKLSRNLKGKLAYGKGLDKVTSNAKLLEAGQKSSTELLQLLQVDPGLASEFKGGSGKKMAEFAKRMRAAGTDAGKREAVRKDFESYLMDKGDAGTEESKSWYTSIKDSLFDEEDEALAEASEAAREQFPQAVDTFARTVENMDRTLNNLQSWIDQGGGR